MDDHFNSGFVFGDNTKVIYIGSLSGKVRFRSCCYTDLHSWFNNYVF